MRETQDATRSRRERHGAKRRRRSLQTRGRPSHRRRRRATGYTLAMYREGLRKCTLEAVDAMATEVEVAVTVAEGKVLEPYRVGVGQLKGSRLSPMRLDDARNIGRGRGGVIASKEVARARLWTTRWASSRT